MEQYIGKLSECQLSESRLREERDTLLRRHERELEELDGRLAAISTQRTQIIDEFKHFLDSPQLLSQNYVQAQNGTAVQTGPPKLLRAESAEATLSADSVGQQWGKPLQTLLTVDTSEAKPNSLCSTPSPTYHSAAHSPNPQAVETEQPAISSDICTKAEPESKVSDEPKSKSKSGRSFKFVHRLAMSKSAGSVPSAITVASPTTTQIESMLFKVRENVHSLDNSTLSQCIDLLSSRILKDKETRINVLSTPDIMPDYMMLSPVPAKENMEVKEVKKRELSRPAPIRQNAQSESVPTSASESQSPMQPSSPKKRIETAEERRRRIERVLLQSPSRISGSTLSRSTTSLNEIDLNSSKRSSLRPSAALSRYGNRNKTKVRRNHSLSPLRFCERNKQLSEERKFLEESKQSEEFSEIRRFKSDQQLDSDSASGLSADDSGNDAENLETDTNETGPQPRVEINEDPVQDESEEICHLLAPSKVAKSQDLFTKTLFPVESTKPLMSKEELAKTRKDATRAFKKKQVQSLSQDSSRGSESPDSAGGSLSLRVDYLSHLRHNSASPEQRSRERELSALSNTKKFKTFMNYWENKTNEIIDKKRNFEQWHQSNTVVGVAPQQPEPVQTSGNLHRSQKVASAQSPVDKTHRQSKSRNTTKMEKPNQSVTSQGIERFTKATNGTTNSTAIAKTSQTASSMRPNQPVKERIVEKPVERSFVVPAATTKQTTQESAVVIPEDKKTNKENFENDHLMQRLRHIQQDIRQRRSKQMDGNQQSAPVPPQRVRQSQPVVQPQPNQQMFPQQQSRPNMQSAKSLDLTYYPMKQQALVQPKSATVKIVQPNGTEPPPTKNRIRLIRPASQNEPDEIAAVVPRQGPRSMAANNGHRHTVDIGHDLGAAFEPIQPKPSQLVSLDSSAMRSTYF